MDYDFCCHYLSCFYLYVSYIVCVLLFLVSVFVLVSVGRLVFVAGAAIIFALGCIAGRFLKDLPPASPSS